MNFIELLMQYREVVNEKQQTQTTKYDLCYLLIGETGAGKTSLINLFHYWAEFGDEFNENPPSYIHAPNERGLGKSKSQTLKPKSYHLKLDNGSSIFNLELIDTPGLGDIGGLELDNENILEILQKASELKKLNRIIMVLNGSNPRVSFRTQYVLQRLYSLCPPEFLQRIVLLFTNSQVSPNFDYKENLAFQIEEDHVFCFDNLIYSQSIQGKSMNEKTKMVIKRNYQSCISVLKQMLVKTAEPAEKWVFFNLTVFKDLVKVRKEIDRMVNMIIEHIKYYEKTTKISSCHSEPSVEELEKRLNFLISLKGCKKETEKISTTFPNVSCINCRTTCQRNHPIHEKLAWCNGDYCKSCNCHSSEHERTFFEFKHTNVDIQLRSKENEEEIERIRRKISEMNSTQKPSQMSLKAFFLSMAVWNLKRQLPHYDMLKEIETAKEMIKEALMIEQAQNRENLENYKVYLERVHKIITENNHMGKNKNKH